MYAILYDKNGREQSGANVGWDGRERIRKPIEGKLEERRRGL